MRGFKVPAHFWLPARFALGLTGPKNKVLGMEVSGLVETIGKGVEKFKVGDEVFAATGFGGGYAEYICLPETDVVGRVVIEVAKKPANLTFEEAAAVPIGGMTALAFVRKANVKNGQKYLCSERREVLALTPFSLLNITETELPAYVAPQIWS